MTTTVRRAHARASGRRAKTVPPRETPRARTERVLSQRVGEALYRIDRIKHCANRNTYVLTVEDVKKVRVALTDAVESTMSLFEAPTSSRRRAMEFTLA